MKKKITFFLKKKEFEVIKINERGARQQRILGIDQFKIYNKPYKISFFVKVFFCNENREYLLFKSIM